MASRWSTSRPSTSPTAPRSNAGVARIEAEFGPIEILFNNAGVNLRGALDAMPDETWHEVIATNLHSAFYCARAVAKGMIARGHGKIINTCSVMSMLGRPTTGPYTASKGAIGMLTKAMCADWAQHGLQCNGIAPGLFQHRADRAAARQCRVQRLALQADPGRPLGRVAGTGRGGGLSGLRAASYVNGHLLYVDGGLTSVV